MRVLQACPYSWDAPGGVQAHVRELAGHLMANGHEVLVLAPGTAAGSEPWVHIVGRPVPIPFNGSRVPLCFGPRAALSVRRALRGFAPDVIHVHEPLSPSIGMLTTLFARAPVVATFHASYDRSWSAFLYRLEALLLRRFVRRVALGIAVSPLAARCISARAPVRLQMIPNGIDPERFAVPRHSNGRRTVLFVNRLERRKGFDVAVRAFEQLAARFEDVDLAVLGDGPERVAVERLAPTVRARVTMLGYRQRAEVPSHYGRADVFLAPATGCESFGVVLLEAMAAGLPIVASDIGGYRAVVRNGIEGLLIPPSDPPALAEALARILEDVPLARRLGEAGRRRAREYAWSTVGRRIEMVYEEAI